MLSSNSVPFFWMNLQRSPDRRKRLEQQFSSNGFENYRVDGIDGCLHDFTKQTGSLDTLTKDQNCGIACYLSHLKCLFTFYKHHSSNVAIICEDDVVFDYMPYWRQSIREVVENAPTEWAVLQLGFIMHNASNWRILSAKNQTYMVISHDNHSAQPGAVGYAITRREALTLLEKFHVDVSKQNFEVPLKLSTSWISETIIFGWGTLSGRYLVYPPMLTFPRENDSLLHPLHLDGHKLSRILSDRYCLPRVSALSVDAKLLIVIVTSTQKCGLYYAMGLGAALHEIGHDVIVVGNVYMRETVEMRALKWASSIPSRGDILLVDTFCDLNPCVSENFRSVVGLFSGGMKFFGTTLNIAFSLPEFCENYASFWFVGCCIDLEREYNRFDQLNEYCSDPVEQRNFEETIKAHMLSKYSDAQNIIRGLFDDGNLNLLKLRLFYAEKKVKHFDFYKFYVSGGQIVFVDTAVSDSVLQRMKKNEKVVFVFTSSAVFASPSIIGASNFFFKAKKETLFHWFAEHCSLFVTDAYFGTNFLKSLYCLVPVLVVSDLGEQDGEMPWGRICSSNSVFECVSKMLSESAKFKNGLSNYSKALTGCPQVHDVAEGILKTCK
jgi:GR25 family glycosyltransferase involved in LPS biosynthesis